MFQMKEHWAFLTLVLIVTASVGIGYFAGLAQKGYYKPPPDQKEVQEEKDWYRQQVERWIIPGTEVPVKKRSIKLQPKLFKHEKKRG